MKHEKRYINNKFITLAYNEKVNKGSVWKFMKAVKKNKLW